VVYGLATMVCGLAAMVYGLAAMVYGLAAMVYGLAAMVYGLAAMVYGLAAMVYGLAAMVYGLAAMVYGLAAMVFGRMSRGGPGGYALGGHPWPHGASHREAVRRLGPRRHADGTGERTRAWHGLGRRGSQGASRAGRCGPWGGARTWTEMVTRKEWDVTRIGTSTMRHGLDSDMVYGLDSDMVYGLAAMVYGP
jgi:hypothetical protein